MTRTVVALYDDFTTAQRAVEDLVGGEFRRDDISLIAHHGDGSYSDEAGTANISANADGDASGAAKGAGVGAAVGGLGGFVVGLATLAIPGVGPVIAAGPIAAGLIGAGGGALAGGLIGTLTEAGIPEEDAHRYAEALRRGGALVAVRASDAATADHAVTLMERHAPLDLEERAGRWRDDAGWTGFDADAPPYTAEERARERESIAGTGAVRGGARVYVIEHLEVRGS